MNFEVFLKGQLENQTIAELTPIVLNLITAELISSRLQRLAADFKVLLKPKLEA
jgi:hypothetical protein